jgi:hypothetical protein
MQIVIAGGTGFLGQALADAFVRDGHDIVILSRAAPGAPQASHRRVVTWTPDGGAGDWARAIDGAGAVVNLAGESIGEGRWTAAKKQRIRDSRVTATRGLVEAIRGAASPPAVFISGSAVGYYGPLRDEIVTEDHRRGSDFLAGVCGAWEDEATGAAGGRTRVVRLRTGLVLDRSGGALPRMLLPFRIGAGGPIGSGRQYWPWIHLRDWVDLVRFVLATPGAEGAVNATGPAPVTNREFATALGRALHRPAFMPTPAFALKLALGEMADGLLLSGQRAVPAKAERLGFRFSFSRVGDALESTLR